IKKYFNYFGISGKIMSQHIAKMWQNESSEIRNFYEKRADVERLNNSDYLCVDVSEFFNITTPTSTKPSNLTPSRSAPENRTNTSEIPDNSNVLYNDVSENSSPTNTVLDIQKLLIREKLENII